MKTLSLFGALLLSVSINATAAQGSHQPTDAMQFAGVSHDVNNAKKLKFTSRRSALNQTVKNKKNNSDEWIGASYQNEKSSQAGTRLNRQFRSKRPHINYQFD